MREYLFRGKRLDNGEWVYGSYLSGYTHEEQGECTWIVDQEFGMTHFVDPKTVGQYIGRSDQDEIKLFEGDVVTCKFDSGQDVFEHSLFVVVFFDFYYSLMDQSNDIVPPEEIAKYGKGIKVIGNIHDNLEFGLKF